MLRTPRSLNIHAIVDPAGDAIRLSSEGNPRICSTVNPRPCANTRQDKKTMAMATSFVFIRAALREWVRSHDDIVSRRIHEEEANTHFYRFLRRVPAVHHDSRFVRPGTCFQRRSDHEVS